MSDLNLKIKYNVNDFKEISFLLVILKLKYSMLFIILPALILFSFALIFNSYLYVNYFEYAKEIYILLLSFIFIIILMPAIDIFLRYSTNLKYLKSKFKLNSIILFDISKDYIRITSKNNNTVYKTSEISKILELKNYFFIYYTEFNLFLPKKFFTDSKQIELFKKISKENIPIKKLKFKYNKFNKYNPLTETNELLSNGKKTLQINVNKDNILYEINVEFKKTEYSKFVINKTYTNPITLFVIIIGIFFLRGSYILFNSDIKDSAPLITCITLSILFIIVIPIILMRTIKSYIIYNINQHYILSDDNLIIKSENNITKIKWEEIRYIKMTKKYLSIIIEFNKIYVIPKKYIDKINDSENLFRLFNKSKSHNI